jgi:two-component system, chemotaxis family, chemotaxis protein CheY
MSVNEDPASRTDHGFRVLVIDNDVADRELTIRHLDRAWHFEHEMVPDEARDAREALDKMRVTRYALVMLDWRLPGMDGGELLRVMRRERILTPVIVTSGMPREHITENIELFGAAFLNKDEMNPVTLRNAIATALRRLGLDSMLAA